MITVRMYQDDIRACMGKHQHFAKSSILSRDCCFDPPTDWLWAHHASSAPLR